MSAFYDDLALTAADLLTEFGQAVTLTHVVSGDYDQATGTTGSGSTTTQTVTGVEEAYSARSIDGTLILMGDKKFHLAPLDTSGAAITPPVAEDKITLADASVWTIKRCEPVSPADTPVLFTLQIRRT